MHQRISKKIFIYLFIFFFTVTISNNKLSNDFYKIKELNIIGLNKLETKNLYEDIKILIDNNIFLFNKKDISKIINSNKTVQEFNITKIYPSKLKIEIKKTNFLALTKKSGINYIVLENGNLLEKKHSSLELPFIFGDINVKNFLFFKNLVDASNFDFKKIKNLYYFKSNRWDILTKDGIIIKMPFNLTLENLNQIFEIIKEDKFENAKIIDFRQNNLMITNE
ncbi:cell division protein FtsQ/DivIB [Candidatus Pelagibacter communis]|uniref:cell division protein FtsQ/DivIB n=1 Tax=Pelagibacter ubique TaxID=198252 RepID=UPI000ABDFC98|nr:FtsQ-type POTRA domain-containing protein [Candidatus Pelagibacter ubique]